MVMLTLGSALLAFGLYKHKLLGPTPALEYGRQLAPQEIEGVGGQVLRLSEGSWYFLMSASTDDLALVKYLSQLMEGNGLHFKSFQPIVLIDDEQEPLTEFEFRNFLTFPVMALHTFPHNELENLGLHGHDRAYALISPSLEVVFASSFLQTNDLRLLLEKHLGTERQGSVRALEPGDAFPSLRLSQVAGPALELHVPGSVREWMVFTAQCITCSLKNQMEQLAEHQELFASQDGSGEVAVIFSSSFDEYDLVAKLQQLRLSTLPVYLSASPVIGLEDPYLQKSLYVEDVLVVDVDDGGRVVEIRGFSEVMQGLRAAGSTR